MVGVIIGPFLVRCLSIKTIFIMAQFKKAVFLTGVVIF